MADLVPDVLRRVWTAGVAQLAAEPFGDQPVFPGQVMIDDEHDADRLFPGWPGPVIVLSIENQGVCTWGVPVGADDPAVLVGGDLTDHGRTTVEYVSGVEAFRAVRLWDGACLGGRSMIQAQAHPIEDAALQYLRRHVEPGPASVGWPAGSQFRFQQAGTRILLWSGREQCDWWISGPPSDVGRVIDRVTSMSSLDRALWSDDAEGQQLLDRLGIAGPWR